jgi:hypothetical protein
MKVRQGLLRTGDTPDTVLQSLALPDAQLVLVFGDVSVLCEQARRGTIAAAFPSAVIAGCSTAGEISGDGVAEGSLTVTALRFESDIGIRVAETDIAGMDDSHAAGERLGRALSGDGLRAVVVFGPGIDVNGSALVEGLGSVVGSTLPVTGGLAGDGGAFKETCTLGPGGCSPRKVVALGLTGGALRFAHGSFGGWDAFGPLRKVTRSAGNVLYELDGEPALEVYKRYLGQYAKDLPASGLLFPFEMVSAQREPVGLIRTILGVDEATGSVTLAGNIDPQGYLRLMHSSTDRLVGGAERAAQSARDMLSSAENALVMLVSCVGRKLVMGQRVEEEVEAVQDVFDAAAAVTGFYSYGEISPLARGAACHLHNQTMTVTVIGEA